MNVVILFLLRRSVSVFECDVVERPACYIVPIERAPFLRTFAGFVFVTATAPRVPDGTIRALMLECHPYLEPLII